MRERDQQRSRVYAAENALDRTLDSDLPTLTLAECQALANKARASYDKGSVLVRDHPIQDTWRWRRAYWSSRTNTIYLPQWGRKKTTVMHEVAHSLAPWGVAAHGPEFVRIFLDLLRQFVPEIPYAMVLEYMRTHRVKAARGEQKVPKLIKPRAVARIEKIRAEIKQHELEIGRLEEELRLIRYGKAA